VEKFCEEVDCGASATSRQPSRQTEDSVRLRCYEEYHSMGADVSYCALHGDHPFNIFEQTRFYGEKSLNEDLST